MPEIQKILNYGIKFAGVSLDNENTANAFFDQLQNRFEWMLHCPCVSHLIQLVSFVYLI